MNCFNGILCDHIVTGIRNDQVQKDSYQNSEHKLTLEKAEKICWVCEKAEEGLNTLKAATNEDQILQEENVNTILHKSSSKIDKNGSRSIDVSNRFFLEILCSIPPIWKKILSCLG